MCDIIWMFSCDWLVGKLSLERDLVNSFGPLRTDLLFSNISVLMKTFDIYEELKQQLNQALEQAVAMSQSNDRLP